MEHIEEAGIHSGDSACSLPPYSLSPSMITELKAETEAMAKAIGVIGLMNVQYAIKDGTIYVLEVNPRASRTVPFVAKATGVPVAKIGARVMAGAKLATDFKLDDDTIAPHVAVKEAVFPFARFPNVDTILGPEMKSTGEVMGIDASFERAFAKSQLGAGVVLPERGTVFLSVKDADKNRAVEVARGFERLGFTIYSTSGTAQKLADAGVKVKKLAKIQEGRPNAVDLLKNKEIQLVINTPAGQAPRADEVKIRTTAVYTGTPIMTTLSGAKAAALGIAALKKAGYGVKTLQEYH
jgi:carbamoyl-phosphate synthase large subunit